MNGNNDITTGLAFVHRDVQSIRCNSDLASLEHTLKQLRQSVDKVYHIVYSELHRSRDRNVSGSL